jgi:DNA-binding response OmpR family regulator
MLPQVSTASSPDSDTNDGFRHPQAIDAGMILLAVDEPSIGRMLVRVLTQAGLKAFWVRDLAQGLGWLRAYRQEVALAFIDCHQTETESRVFCRCARNINPRLPVMLAGGAEAQCVVEDLSIEGSSTFVPKPYLPTELTWQLRANMRRAAV